MARLIDQVIGHSQLKERFFVDVERFPHTVIFSGESGIGKFKMALAMAQRLVCASGGCGTCGPCIRIEKQQSESLLVVRPENLQIKVDRARDVIRFTSLKGGRRVIIIDQAEGLNTQAANALLKTLEEPPDDIYIIMVTSSLYTLLPTIRSRSQIIRFGRMSLPEMQKIFPEANRDQLAAAHGLPSRVSSEDGNERKTRVLEYVERAMQGQRSSTKGLADTRDDGAESLETVHEILRDWLHLRFQAADKVLHPDISSRVSQLQLNEEVVRRASEQLLSYHRMLMLNVDRQLIFDNLAENLAGRFLQSEHGP